MVFLMSRDEKTVKKISDRMEDTLVDRIGRRFGKRYIVLTFLIALAIIIGTFAFTLTYKDFFLQSFSRAIVIIYVSFSFLVSLTHYSKSILFKPINLIIRYLLPINEERVNTSRIPCVVHGQPFPEERCRTSSVWSSSAGAVKGFKAGV